MKREQRWSEHQHQEKLFEEDVFVISCYGRKNRGSGLVVMIAGSRMRGCGVECQPGNCVDNFNIYFCKNVLLFEKIDNG